MTTKTFFLGSRSASGSGRKYGWLDLLPFPFSGPAFYRAHWLRDPATGKIVD